MAMKLACQAKAHMRMCTLSQHCQQEHAQHQAEQRHGAADGQGRHTVGCVHGAA